MGATPLPRPKPRLKAAKPAEVVAAIETGKKKAVVDAPPGAKSQPAMKALPTIDAEAATQKPGTPKKKPAPAAPEAAPAPAAAAAAPLPLPGRRPVRGRRRNLICN